MKKLLIATVLTAACGIGGVTFASANDVQNNNEPIKMNLLVERNCDVNHFQDKKSDMPSECQNNQIHGQHRMGHMPMNHQDDNMPPHGDGDQMRPEGQQHQMRPEGQNHQMRPEGQQHQMRPQGQPHQMRPQGQPHQMRPQGHNHQMLPQGQPPQQPNGNAPQPPMEQGASQTTQHQ